MTRLKYPIAAALACAALVATAPANAESEALKPPLLSVSAEASREVANDEMTVNLRVERQHAELAVANREALEKMNQLIARAREVRTVETSLSGVGSNALYSQSTGDARRERRITGWHVYADASLRSRDINALSKLVGMLSEQARILSVGFSVSKQTRKRVEAELLVEAAKAFNERAHTTAVALGYAGFEIQNVNISTGGGARPPFRPMLQEAIGAKAAVAPDFGDALGESTINANAGGSVWLRR